MMIAFTFPGQGSQSVGMLAEHYQMSSIVEETFSEASEVLGFDLLDLILHGPLEKLNQTEYTQPALLASSVAIYRIWLDQNTDKIDFMVGHSLGEYSALVCAGVIRFKDAVQLVANRGRLMQSAVVEGAGSMAAILGMEDDKVIQVCEELTNETIMVSAANFNAPGQVVVAGHTSAVQRLIEKCKLAGAKAVLLPVSVPSHCELMRGAAETLNKHLLDTEIQPAQIPVLHNVDGLAKHSPDDIRFALSQQLYQPVQWTKSIENLVVSGVTHLLECGPGKVLTGLTRRINRRLIALPLKDPADITKAIKHISGGK